MPQLATLICILFILYLFWMDRKKSDGPSNASMDPFDLDVSGRITICFVVAELRHTHDIGDCLR